MFVTLFRNLMGRLLKYFWKLEEKLFQGIARFRQGTDTVKITDIKILHESPHFIVVDKHHDVIINTVEKHRISLHRQLERLYPDLVNIKLQYGFYYPHRLDFATSGIMCIAKTRKACGAAGTAFAQRSTKKFYLAILRGHLSQNYLRLDEGIGEDIREKFKGIRMAGASSEHVRKDTIRDAVTHLVVLERGICYGYPARKVLLRPITGRRHQLRIHCHNIGHRIVGDFTYSNRFDSIPYRMFLHAYKLEMNSKIEPLNIVTQDPFLPCNPKNKWESYETVISIPDAINLISENQLNITTL